MVGFGVIVVLYVVIGILAAAGAVCFSRRLLAPKAEQIVYALFLIPVAGFYLAFADYFRETTAWRLETFVVLGFIVLALLGTRLPYVLMAGYCLHGGWDFVHELQAHGGYSAFAQGKLTAIPLAYGFFCTAFDFYVAVYGYKRRGEWNEGWRGTK